MRAEWAAAIGTVVLAFVAVFQQWLQRIFIRPCLHLDARVQRPDAEKTHWTIRIQDPQGRVSNRDADVYYFRLAITNTGNAAAHDVQVYLEKVERLRADKRYDNVERFSPMNLKWTHLNSPTRPILLPKMPPVFCDLAHITYPHEKRYVQETLPDADDPNSPVLCLDLEVPPNSRGHLLEAGTYLFHLRLAASDHNPKQYKLEVVFQGEWYDDQSRMFREGFGMRLL